MMRRFVFHRGSQYTSVLLLRRLLGVSVTIPAAHLFGVVFYGQLVLTASIVFIVSTAASFGLQVVAFRGAGNDDANAVSAVGTILCIIVPVVGVCISGLVLLCDIRMFGLPPLWTALAIVTGAISPSSSAYLFAILRSKNRSSAYVKANIMMLVIGFALKAILVFIFHLGVLAWLFADLLAGLLGWTLAVTMYRPSRAPWVHIRSALRGGTPMIPHLLLHWIVSGVDRFFIERYCGIAAVGIYSAAYQIPEFVGSTMGETNAAFMPRYLSSAKDGDVKSAATTQVKVSGALVLATALVGPLVTLNLFPPEFASGVTLIPTLALAYLGYGVYLIAANVITLSNDTTKRMWLVSGTAGLVNVALNFALIPRIGVWGAAVATLGAYGAMLLQGIYRTRRLPIQTQWLEGIREGKLAWVVAGCFVAQAMWLWIH